MGVPAFYRWLSEKYPKIVHDVLEVRNAIVDGVEIPADLTQPNPNDIEYDNLYVDMNGLIHPCSHPEDREAPSTEAEMYLNVTKYVDRLFAAVRPRKVLFLAIDGVAPRAKMNQQRSRRFRAALDAKDRQKMLDEVLQEIEEIGAMKVQATGGDGWDSNVITPGTEFMYNLSIFLRFYILDRMNKFEAWRNIKVILSDANEPGEGEHKIMKFIRSERCQPGYNPNQHHILHGLDADLIMLALATHEPHFTILRELVTFGGKQKGDKVSQSQQLLDAQNNKPAVCLNPEDEWVFGKPLQALHINILREYLVGEFQGLQNVLPFPYDFERIIDDFVFLCFFVGNDFLPHLPSLDIRDGALDFLIECYKDTLPVLGSYITSPGGVVNLTQADIILSKVGEIEDLIFQRKKAAEAAQERNANQRRNNYNNNKDNSKPLVVVETAVSQASYNNQTGLGLGGRNNHIPLTNSSHINHLITNTKDSSTPKFIIKAIPVSNKDAAKTLREKVLGKKRVLPSLSNETDTIDSINIDQTLSVANKKQAVSVVSISGEEVVEAVISTGVLSEETCNTSTTTNILASNESITVVPTNSLDIDGVIESKNIIDENVDETAVEPAETEPEEVEMDDLLASVLSQVKIPMKAENSVSSSHDEKPFIDPNEIKNRLKIKQNAMLDKYKETTQDHIKLHEDGWKQRYYDDPPKRENLEQNGGLPHMCFTYVQGLCWVLKYYYEGCPSWSWYYPFHYAPFASDLINIDRYTISFELSQPFEPIEQLLAVLPAESVHALPPSCQWLMTEETSPIKDLYDSDSVAIDPNGKHLPWLWILLLPFVDERRIKKAFANCKNKLNIDELRRNAFSGSFIFLHKRHQLSTALLNNQSDNTESVLYKPKPEDNIDILNALKILQKNDKDIGITFDSHDSVVDASVDNVCTTQEIEMISHISGGNNDTDETTATVNKITDILSDMNYTTNATMIDNRNNLITYFDANAGDGITGGVSSPPFMWYFRLESLLPAPKQPPFAFLDIKFNQVLCLVFLYPVEKPYDSCLLPGYIPINNHLDASDLIPRRPPKLNKSRFNMLDLSRERQNRQHQQQYGQQSNNQSYGQRGNNNYKQYNGNNNQQRNNYMQNQQSSNSGYSTFSSSNNYNNQPRSQHSQHQYSSYNNNPPPHPSHQQSFANNYSNNPNNIHYPTQSSAVHQFSAHSSYIPMDRSLTRFGYGYGSGDVYVATQTQSSSPPPPHLQPLPYIQGQISNSDNYNNSSMSQSQSYNMQSQYSRQQPYDTNNQTQPQSNRSYDNNRRGGGGGDNRNNNRYDSNRQQSSQSRPGQGQGHPLPPQSSSQTQGGRGGRSQAPPRSTGPPSFSFLKPQTGGQQQPYSYMKGRGSSNNRR